MKTLLTILVIVTFATLFVSCKTSSPTSPGTNSNGTPTPIGTPIGSPSSATIDAAGGSLMSPDGRLELIVPAGALSSATPISIQPVTNECPVGTGIGFSLTPNGQKFNQPITLRFHYSQDDLIGSAAKELAVATQKDDRIWYAFNDPILDTTARTLSISSPHFSMYALCHDIWITPATATIKINESQKLEVKQWKVTNLGTTSNPIIVIDGDMTYPQGDQVSWIINGKILGSQADGVVSPNISSSTTTYYAPASTKGMTSNPAQVSGEVNLTDGSQTIVFSNIKVVGEELLHVSVALKGTKLDNRGGFIYDYTDSASFDITYYANGDSASIYNIKNIDGKISNWVDDPGDCIHSILDPSKPGNFLQVDSAVVLPSHDGDNAFYFQLFNRHIDFAFRTDCQSGFHGTTAEEIYNHTFETAKMDPDNSPELVIPADIWGEVTFRMTRR